MINIARAVELIGRNRTHLAEAGESYFEHMGFAAAVGSRMVIAGAACLLHAVFPALFTDTASRTIRALAGVIQDRSTATALFARSEERSTPLMPLVPLALGTAALPWIAGAGVIFALPLALLSASFPLAALYAARGAG